MLLPALFHTASALSAPAGPLPLEGKGDRGAVDRVLSLTVICAKTFFHLHHPLSCRSAPQPPPCGHLLPKEGGIDTLETPHILAPSSGRGCRAQRDGVGSPVCWKCVSSVSLSLPLSGIAFYKNQREASLRLSLPLEEKADDTG